MGIASRKTAVGVRESRRGLDGNPQSWDGIRETPAEEQSGTYQERIISCRGARAEAEGDLSMPDREMRFAGPQSQLLMCQPRA